MSNTVHSTDLINTVELEGHVKWIARKPDGKIVDQYEHSNSILLQIRQPIIKLLGAFGNVHLSYNVNYTGWNQVPDTNVVQSVNGDISLQVVPTTLPYVARVGFGSDGTPATVNDTGLILPIAGGEKLLAAAPTFSADGLRVTFATLLDLNELNDVEIREAVLKTVDGTAIARAPIGYYRKIAGVIFEYYHTIGYQG